MDKIELKEFFSEVESFCNACEFPCNPPTGSPNCLLYGMRGFPVRAKVNRRLLEQLMLPTDDDYEIVKRIKSPRKYPK